MAKIIFTTRVGEIVVDADPGTSVMQAAVAHGVPGIIGECGGDMSCATCHVHVEDQTGFRRQSADEADLLELADEVTVHSRLGCQLKLTAATTEVRIGVPAS